MQRERELAVRRALGAARSRVIVQLLVENALLATAAAVFGLLIAWAIRNLLASMPSYTSEIYARLPLDFRVVLFTACLLGLVILLFGFIPAVRVSDVELASAMKASQLTNTSRRNHLRFISVVAAAEVAIVVGLSSSAVLMVKSFWNLRYRELGIQTEHVVAATLSLTTSKYKDRDREFAFLDSLLAQIKAIPGIEVAALSVGSEIPPGEGHVTQTVRIEGRPLPVDSRSKPQARYQVVSASYLNVLGIPLLDGRFVRDSDGPSAPSVVVISHNFAARYFPDKNSIGQHLSAGDMRDGVWYTVVGVVGDAKSSGPASRLGPVIYVPYGQTTGNFVAHDMGVVLRSWLPIVAIAPALRDIVASIDPEQPVSTIQTIDERLNESVARPAFTASLLSALSLVGTLLAIIGVYGLISCRVRSQLRELAVRQALGAPRWQIIGHFLRSAAAVTVFGLAFGLAITLASTQLLSAMLFEVSPREPLVLGGVCMAVLVASLSACVVPAWRATKSDPLAVLREN